MRLSLSLPLITNTINHVCRILKQDEYWIFGADAAINITKLPFSALCSVKTHTPILICKRQIYKYISIV